MMMSEPTQEMLDAWAKIPKPTDQPYCRVCRSTDVSLLTSSVVTHRWDNTRSEWVQTITQDLPASQGCNECKSLDLPVQTRFYQE